MVGGPASTAPGAAAALLTLVWFTLQCCVVVVVRVGQASVSPGQSVQRLIDVYMRVYSCIYIREFLVSQSVWVYPPPPPPVRRAVNPNSVWGAEISSGRNWHGLTHV